ncbi:MAG: Membrane protein involved in colicin uptake [Candidatus Saccharibacteria bacterium]|nr:Membrane protein involved in colicin uptake [Candidatus Saccharibacteria bacterium]
MAERVEKVTETVVRDDSVAPAEPVVTEPVTDRVPAQTVVARVIWLIAGIIMGLLAVRFVLSLLGANRGNAFADLVYSLSYPFAAPFFGLFGYNVQYGAARFEFETLVAILVYALLATLIAKIATIRSRSQY